MFFFKLHILIKINLKKIFRSCFSFSSFSGAFRGPLSKFHLSLAELQHLGQSFPLGWRQVLLRLEFLLQLDGLVVGETDLASLSLV